MLSEYETTNFMCFQFLYMFIFTTENAYKHYD